MHANILSIPQDGPHATLVGQRQKRVSRQPIGGRTPLAINCNISLETVAVISSQTPRPHFPAMHVTLDQILKARPGLIFGNEPQRTATLVRREIESSEQFVIECCCLCIPVILYRVICLLQTLYS
ncbi:hypothetical protein FVEG_16545 [Fusarium verticillioides 7600]|uniref:Uncharacterized protein n=1 Tax=Gibberella moniliformis (strain M3125 / FGSC 7600) TaxID=334819 RepID=W7MZS2_GIBM7|nr:hypothetical protein FVEG_16545 [Fusarium verticillioides 7600]EWG49882.1 hypothetical protein FVEG_16545 [Fusarium verticillioides 7600]